MAKKALRAGARGVPPVRVIPGRGQVEPLDDHIDFVEDDGEVLAAFWEVEKDFQQWLKEDTDDED